MNRCCLHFRCISLLVLFHISYLSYVSCWSRGVGPYDALRPFPPLIFLPSHSCWCCHHSSNPPPTSLPTSDRHSKHITQIAHSSIICSQRHIHSLLSKQSTCCFAYPLSLTRCNHRPLHSFSQSSPPSSLSESVALFDSFEDVWCEYRPLHVAAAQASRPARPEAAYQWSATHE